MCIIMFKYVLKGSKHIISLLEFYQYAYDRVLNVKYGFLSVFNDQYGSNKLGDIDS